MSALSSSSSSSSSLSYMNIHEKLTPPTSPLQRVKNPFACALAPRNPSSRRSRTLGRVVVLIIALVVMGTAVNQYVCKETGRLARTDWLNDAAMGMRRQGGQTGRYIGGGSVLPGAWKSVDEVYDKEALEYMSQDERDALNERQAPQRDGGLGDIQGRGGRGDEVDGASLVDMDGDGDEEQVNSHVGAKQTGLVQGVSDSEFEAFPQVAAHTGTGDEMPVLGTMEMGVFQ